MPDLSSDGRPQQLARDIQIRGLQVDLHGLEHTIVRAELEMMRRKYDISQSEQAIVAATKRITELHEEIEELENG